MNFSSWEKSLVSRTLLILAILAVCVCGIVTNPIRLGLDLRGGVSLILQVRSPEGASTLGRDLFEQTRQVLERRVNAYGLSEADVIPYGTRGDELLVQMPGVTDPEHVRRLLATRAVLEWRSVEEGPYVSADEARAQHGGILLPGRKLLPFGQPPDERWFVLGSVPVLRGNDLRDARAAVGEMRRPVTTFTLSQAAARRFERYTGEHLGKQAAIVLDNRILSVATIESVIRDAGEIRGAFSLQEAQDLALNLRGGALPAEIVVLKEGMVSASLGAESIRQGLRAGAAGLAAVVGTMVVYYRRAGVNATLALALNGILVLAGLAWFGAVLTLPGIAGVILTIGMAVDSNVLIFERIREELRAGKPSASALAAGFTKAFGTLVDTHVTTVVSCCFLFLFGTPSVKGFAITLLLGLITNLFTSVFVSRVAFEWELRAGELRI